MYTIATLETELQAAALGARLRREGIRYAIELCRTGRGDRFNIDILRDEDIKKARRIVESFNPAADHPMERPLAQDEPIIPKARLAEAHAGKIRAPRPICLLFVFLCALFFFVHEVQRREIIISENRAHIDMPTLTPAMRWMLIDLPDAYTYLTEFQNSFPSSPNAQLNHITKEQRQLLDKMEQTPFWGGIYPMLVAKVTGSEIHSNGGELFQSVRRGEIWRLLSPGFLHDSLLHLFFNMFLLLSIGSLVERRIGSSRFLVLILLLLVVTNTSQYIVSGPLFVGFSGVACGFVGFVFARRQTAPWENYHVEPAIFWVFFGYVGVLVFIEVILFSLALLKSPVWPTRIANTSHVTGILLGYGLGRLSAFGWKVRT